MMETIRYKKIKDFIEDLIRKCDYNSSLGYPDDEAYNKSFREALQGLEGRFTKRETDRVLKRIEPIREKYFSKEEDF